MTRSEFTALSNIIDETKTILEKIYIMFDRVLNTPLTMIVSRYWESISNKTKFLFSVLAKKTQVIFFLENGSTCEMLVN